MAVIEDLYLALERFVAAGQPTAASLRALTDQLLVPRSTFSFIDRPIPFRAEMWEREETGLWHKRRSGEQFLTAIVR